MDAPMLTGGDGAVRASALAPPRGRARRADPDGRAASSPLRVLHVVESFGAGTYEVVRTLSAGMVSRGHAVAIAHGARGETPESVPDTLHPGVAVFPLPWARRTPEAQAAAARELRSVVDSWQPQLVHLHSSFAGLLGAAVLGGGRVPLVYTPHGYSFSMRDKPRAARAGFRALERYVARRVAVVGAVSQSEAELARRVARAPAVAVVENGIPELDDDPPDRLTAKRPLVVAAGRPTAARQPEACARILAAASDLAETVWLGGGRTDSRAIRRLRAAGVAVTGWIDRGQALAGLRDALVYLHWSAWDGLPLAVLEAMAEDALVVASDIPANREILGGVQVRASEQEAAGLIRSALLDPQVHRRLLEEQRARRLRFGAQRMVDGWLSTYSEVLAGAASRRAAKQPAELQEEFPGDTRILEAQL